MTGQATLPELSLAVRDHHDIARWLPQLDEWLLPESLYGVAHTWPLLYRSAGQGRFLTLTAGDELISHCAWRCTSFRTPAGPHRIALLGSVATAVTHRRRGYAGRLLATALQQIRGEADHVLLWAEQGGLYAQHAFVAGGEESCLQLARRPRSLPAGFTVRLAAAADLPSLHQLHAAKPVRVDRDREQFSTLLGTPGLRTVVAERHGRLVAYACCGKGADLQGFWHELGGSDDDLAQLLPAALHLTEQIQAILVLPPYRPRLPALLAPHTIAEFQVAGPMVLSWADPLPSTFVDGLDSV